MLLLLFHIYESFFQIKFCALESRHNHRRPDSPPISSSILPFSFFLCLSLLVSLSLLCIFNSFSFLSFSPNSGSSSIAPLSFLSLMLSFTITHLPIPHYSSVSHSPSFLPPLPLTSLHFPALHVFLKIDFSLNRDSDLDLHFPNLSTREISSLRPL